MDGTKVTIQCPAMPGRIVILSDETRDNAWIATRKGFDPYEVEAVDLSSAVQQVMLNIHMFSRSAEFRAKRAASKAIKAEREKVEAAKNTRSNKREQQKPEVAVA